VTTGAVGFFAISQEHIFSYFVFQGLQFWSGRSHIVILGLGSFLLVKYPQAFLF